jgi:hypothetical protein
LDYAPCWELLQCGHNAHDNPCPAAWKGGSPCWEICARLCSRVTQLCTACPLRANQKPAPERLRAAD